MVYILDLVPYVTGQATENSQTKSDSWTRFLADLRGPEREGSVWPWRGPGAPSGPGAQGKISSSLISNKMRVKKPRTSYRPLMRVLALERYLEHTGAALRWGC